MATSGSDTQDEKSTTQHNMASEVEECLAMFSSYRNKCDRF